jgi:hypothetical protein
MFTEKYKSYLYSKYDNKRSDLFEPQPKKKNVLGKRKLADAFGEEIYNDQDRYGQDIPDDFFKTNVGHDVY